ncbi:MAG: hypothetical protein NTW59_00930 [Candidatus Diapherotrites archaeon]|nr:hypothetical protein [Candidatus Diapherotrites archaeon]
MKFFQGFFALLAIAGAIFYAAFNFIAEGIAHAAVIAAGGFVLALDIFAFAVWFVNWRYYPEKR